VCDQVLASIPLPSGWPENVKSAVLYVISLAHYAITRARGWAANSINARVRLAAKSDRLQQEVELLHEQIRIRDARMARLDPRRRPHYTATERMAILEFKAARGWSLAQTAKAFLVQPRTIASWLKKIDEEGNTALVQLREPVNKFPDFIRYIVQRLKALCPSLGKRKIAQILARAGLHLGSTTVQRMIKSKAVPPPTDPVDQADQADRVVTAKRPDQIQRQTVVPRPSNWPCEVHGPLQQRSLQLVRRGPPPPRGVICLSETVSCIRSSGGVYSWRGCCSPALPLRECPFTGFSLWTAIVCLPFSPNSCRADVNLGRS